MLPLTIFAFALASTVVAENQSAVVNIINPLWAPFKNHHGVIIGDPNYASAFAASVVGVNSAETTYSIGCKPNASTTNLQNYVVACTSDLLNGIFITQNPTNLHFSLANGIPTSTISFSANYIFSSTLAETVTATETAIEGDASISPSEFDNYPTGAPATTDISGGTRTIAPGGNSTATWFPLPITGGIEHLSTITPAANLESSAASSASPSSTSTPSGGSRSVKTSYYFVAVIFGPIIFYVI